MRGLERAIDVRVRRGKRGVGVSIDKALAKLLRHVALPSMGAEVEIRAMAAELLGCGATVEAPEFGHVVVRPVRERPESVLYTTWRKLSDHMPIHIALTVEQAHG